LTEEFRIDRMENKEQHTLMLTVILDDVELLQAQTTIVFMDQLEQGISELTDRIVESIKAKREGKLKYTYEDDGIGVVDNNSIRDYEDEHR
tara:strand:- start:48920 stop:49192 length:273 start_codon:yes stop_codon:yes gene_type:complete